MAGAGRRKLGALSGDHIDGWQETLFWPSCRNRRWRQHSGCGGEVMRSILIAGILGLTLLPMGLQAQTATRKAASSRSAIPRMPDGKPDLTGVWQGGSTQRGSWEEANTGTGVGGSGRDPAAPVAASSNDRPAGREGAPYQPWAAQKVLEAFNRRGIDDPTALCLPAGLPRTVMLGLFPQQIVQTSTQIIMLYEYMNVFRVIPLNA